MRTHTQSSEVMDGPSAGTCWSCRAPWVWNTLQSSLFYSQLLRTIRDEHIYLSRRYDRGTRKVTKTFTYGMKLFLSVKLLFYVRTSQECYFYCFLWNTFGWPAPQLSVHMFRPSSLISGSVFLSVVLPDVSLPADSSVLLWLPVSYFIVLVGWLVHYEQVTRTTWRRRAMLDHSGPSRTEILVKSIFFITYWIIYYYYWHILWYPPAVAFTGLLSHFVACVLCLVFYLCISSLNTHRSLRASFFTFCIQVKKYNIWYWTSWRALEWGWWLQAERRWSQPVYSSYL